MEKTFIDGAERRIPKTQTSKWIYECDNFKEIQRGSYGIILELYKSGKSTNLVVKELLNDCERRDRRRFIREIEILEKLKGHGNIVEVIHSSTDDDLPWFIMPKADCNLFDFIKDREDVLDEDEALYLLEGILNAMEYAHSNKVIHRDLAPQNVLIYLNSTSYSIKVSDFGIGRKLDSNTRSLTRTNDTQLGHDAFTAPEQLKHIRNSSIQSDIYSIGAILSFMLTREDPRMIKATGDLGFIVRKCMEYQPDKRPKNVAEIRKLIGIYKSSSNSVIYSLEDIINSFKVNNSVSDDELRSLSKHLSQYAEYKDGGITYERYFSPLLDIPEPLIKYWLSNVTIDEIRIFVENYSKQLLNITEQVRWSFKRMEYMSKLIMTVFHNVKNSEMKAKIFATLIDVHYNGFGEVWNNLVDIITGKYDNNTVSEIAAILLDKKEKILSELRDENEFSIRHIAFIEVLEN